MPDSEYKTKNGLPAVQYSQRDPKWVNVPLGLSTLTIGSYGCLLTASSMLLSNHGFAVNPAELNKLLQKNNGFSGALMYYSVLASLFPVKVNLIPCKDTPAPLDVINKSLDNNYPVIAELDFSPSPGFQNHWVVIYKHLGDTYWISDPWSLHPESELVTLQSRYGFVGTAKDIITNVLLVEPFVQTDSPVSEETSSLKLPTILEGEKIQVLIDGLRVRLGPGTKNLELGMVKAGTEFVSAGESIIDGSITWQPVVVYVATNYGSDLYIKPVKK